MEQIKGHSPADLFRYSCEYLSGVIGIAECTVERNVLFNLQKVHRIFQCLPASAVFKCQAEQLLHI